MGRLWKVILFLIVLGILAFIGFAYLGDISPEQGLVQEPVELDGS